MLVVFVLNKKKQAQIACFFYVFKLCRPFILGRNMGRFLNIPLV